MYTFTYIVYNWCYYNLTLQAEDHQETNSTIYSQCSDLYRGPDFHVQNSFRYELNNPCTRIPDSENKIFFTTVLQVFVQYILKSLN